MSTRKPRSKSAHLLHRSGLFRESLATALAQDLRVVQIERDTVAQYREQLLAAPPDLAMIDVSLPKGSPRELTAMVREESEETRVLLLVRENCPECWDRMIECIGAGAHGCLLEESSLSELRRAIDSLLRGDTFCSARILDSMFGELARLPSDVRHRQMAGNELTPRELEILELVAEGNGNKQIAKQLSLSVHTVKNHVHNILEKLQADSRHKAVDYARERRWISAPTSPATRGRW